MMSGTMLGETVQDIVTGFQGVVTGYVQYLTGCNQALVQPRVSEDGAMRESQWIDVQRLTRRSDHPRVVLDNASTSGADREPPKR